MYLYITENKAFTSHYYENIKQQQERKQMIKIEIAY